MFSKDVLAFAEKYSGKNPGTACGTDFYKKQFVSETSFLPESAKAFQRIWHVTNNTEHGGVCIVCGNATKWNRRDYRRFCSSKCAGSSDETKQRRIETNLDKFGFAYNAQSPEAKKKSRETSQKKYGVDNPSQSAVIKERKRQTNLERRGVACSFQDSEVKQKIRETNLRRRGCVNPGQDPKVQEQIQKTNLGRYRHVNAASSPEIKARIKQTFSERFEGGHPLRDPEVMKKVRKTNLDRYGVEVVTQNPEILERSRQTNLRERGVEWTSQDPEVRAAQKRTNKERYGVSNFNHAHIDPDCLAKVQDPDWLRTQHHTKERSFMNIAKGLSVSPSTVEAYARKFDIETRYYGQSEGEEFLARLIQHFYSGEIIQNTRQVIPPQELDIYLPELKLAFEFNGLYWHSSEKKSLSYHRQKTEKCRAKGIRLVHIFENEIINPIKRKIVISRIRVMLGAARTIGARKCQIVALDNSNAKPFLTHHHVQGYVPATVNYGLVYQRRLVAIMTFGKPRFNKDYQWELLRFCCRRTYVVQGAASRLFKHFIKHNSGSVLSYCDLRWGTGGVYQQLGMQHIRQTKPNFWYFCDSQHLYSRVRFQRHRLPNLLEEFDPDLTADENLFLHGFRKIYDCGSAVYVFDKGVEYEP